MVLDFIKNGEDIKIKFILNIYHTRDRMICILISKEKVSLTGLNIGITLTESLAYLKIRQVVERKTMYSSYVVKLSELIKLAD